MKRVLASAGVLVSTCLLAVSASAGTVDYTMVTVGNPGNANDTGGGGIGAVDSSYQIGKYDVTIAQYTAFLNAADPNGTNPNGIYNSSMGTNLNIAGISYTDGAAAGSKYSVMAVSGSSPYGGVSNGNRPITYVSWFDAARFSNWMTNGQGGGSTETGAYTLNNATSGDAVAKNPGAAFYIPTQSEWYKSAYYDPTLNSGSGGYYAYATQSNSLPGNTIGATANQANRFSFTSGYAVTHSIMNYSTQNYLTDVGAFTGSGSFYDTFDQTGNVYQWNDLDGAAGALRGQRGGWYSDIELGLSSSSSFSRAPSYVGADVGFRLASPLAAVPEIDPATGSNALALIAGVLAMIERRRRRGSLSVWTPSVAFTNCSGTGGQGGCGQ